MRRTSDSHQPATLLSGSVVVAFALLICAVLFILGAYWWASGKAREEIRSAGDRHLQIISLDLESVLERYETLPYALAYLPLASQILATPGDAQKLAQFHAALKDIQQQSKLAAIYLMDKNGNTIAASNWDTPQSFMGQNFSFRPYFKEAIQGGTGHFYAIGNTTSVPGYFISQPVFGDGSGDDNVGESTDKNADENTHQLAGKKLDRIRSAVHNLNRSPKHTPIGVIAVKISLTEFEKAWRSSEEPIALSDQHGVIFLSNRPAWQYHSLQTLNDDVQRLIAQTLQYGGKPIASLASLPKSERADIGTLGESSRDELNEVKSKVKSKVQSKIQSNYVTRPIGRLSWQLMLFPSESTIRRAGIQAALVAFLLLILLATAAAVFHQRRRRLDERHLARQELQSALQQAADDLEQRIALRTQELTHANAQLATKYSKLQDAENLLRSTQDEMVQTGKLAMLGQMAAGMTHELNQPLTAIRAFADNAMTFLARGKVPQANENLQHISDASARMGAIISQLKGFARKSPEAVAEVDLALSLKAAALLMQSEFERQNVALLLSSQTGLLVLGDAVRIEQVLINLMRNALDSVVQKMQRQQEIEYSQHGPTQVSVLLEADEQDAIIRIIDTGTGLPEQVIQHLFEPFFTTKASEQGLGLGLAISSSIVQAMNGSLCAENRLQGGAEFTVKIPRWMGRV